MTIKNEKIVLWDSGREKLCLLSVPFDNTYKYIDGVPCITVGVIYESERFKGYDEFTFFDHFYIDLLRKISDTYNCLNGKFRLYDMGANTDGYIDFEMSNGKLNIKGQLGASFSAHSLVFGFEADQTLLEPLMQNLSV